MLAVRQTLTQTSRLTGWEVDQNNIGILAQPIKDDVRATGRYVEGQHRRWIVIQPLNAPCAACQLKFVARPAHLRRNRLT